MILLIIFAFIAGIVTILSPCILPILPIVLSGSLTGGRKRPLGIVTGFILSFTFFTLFLSTIVKVTGVSADFLRQLSVVVVFSFGVSLLVPKFQIWMEQLFSRLAGAAPKNNQDAGFVGGVLVGLSLGLVWAPCVGPILASVITLAATGSVSASAVIITLAYSVGTALPMLAITYGGRGLLNKVPWLLTNSARIQKAFGVLMIATAVAIYFNADRKFQTIVLTTFPNYGTGLTKIEDNPAVKNALRALTNQPVDETKTGKPMFDVMPTDLGAAPEFIAGGQWFNTSTSSVQAPLTMAGLKGKVVLVDFWTYTCINCIRTLPYTKAWWEKYKDKGFVLVGVHTPEFAFEHEADNVATAIRDFGITYPVMQDNDYATWNAYSNRYWPAHYFIDKNGRIRKTHFGEGGYDESEAFIQELLAETGEVITEKPNNPTYEVHSRTPETYLGFQRLAYLTPEQRVSPSKQTSYVLPETVEPNVFALGGTWTVEAEMAMPHKGATLLFNFNAANVFLVMRPASRQGGPKTEGAVGSVRVSLDGATLTDGNAGEDIQNNFVTVDTDRLYKLIKLQQPGPHLLRLDFLDSNLEIFAFTFG